VLTKTDSSADARRTAVRCADSDVAQEAWVFAYGSLMWRPGFRFADAVRASLHGYRRGFCIYSVFYRGSLRRPGLVLGLQRGGLCEGIAYRIAADDAAEALAYIRAREQVSGVYREKLVQVAIAGEAGRTVTALTFVAEKRHPSFARTLPLRRQARVIRGAVGGSGSNVDYLVNTIKHLAELKIRDRQLERLLTLTGAYFANGEAREGHRARAKPLVQQRQSLEQLKISRSALELHNRFAHRRILDGL
jgi:cation transport protein ChaC